MCVSWTIDTPTDVWVNSVALENGGGYHHSNWYFVPKEHPQWDMPDGVWDCPMFNDLVAAVSGGVLFAQSTQSTLEEPRFPEGVALRMPSGSRIVANTHLLNASSEEVTTFLRLTVETIPAEEVSVQLTPFRLSYNDLQIAAQKRTEHRATCDIATAHQQTIGAPFEMDIYYALPHYHDQGDLFRLQLAGGPREGETVFEVSADLGEPWGQTFDPPIALGPDGETGLTFSCGFDNPGTQEVGWGIGDQEMCVMLGFAETKMAFEGAVNEGRSDSIEESDALRSVSGPCSVTGVPFMQAGENELSPSCADAMTCCPTLDPDAERTCMAAVASNNASTC